MSDERLIGALRALDRPVDVDAGFGEALYAILEGEYARRRQFGPRLAWLLVAALLTALLVGGAVAVGSGLVRLPWLTDRSLIPTAGCPADLLAPPAETRVTEITAEAAIATLIASVNAAPACTISAAPADGSSELETPNAAPTDSLAASAASGGSCETSTLLR